MLEIVLLYASSPLYVKSKTDFDASWLLEDLEQRFKKKGILDNIIAAGGMDGINDPIIWRRSFNCLLEFGLKYDVIDLDDD